MLLNIFSFVVNYIRVETYLTEKLHILMESLQNREIEYAEVVY